MRAVVQRVIRAEVRVDSEIVGSIERGLCALVGVMADDSEADACQLARKVASLRVFVDHDDRMNWSLSDVGGGVLAVSQFTLAGDVRRGNRPSFVLAMEPGAARGLFERFCAELRALSLPVATGRFRAHMELSLVNDGPVTILLDTRRTF